MNVHICSQASAFRDAAEQCRLAMLDALSTALRNLPTTELRLVPRMADFALLATASESALNLAKGEFLRIYLANREGANATALEASPVADAVKSFAEERYWKRKFCC